MDDKTITSHISSSVQVCLTASTNALSCDSTSADSVTCIRKSRKRTFSCSFSHSSTDLLEDEDENIGLACTDVDTHKQSSNNGVPGSVGEVFGDVSSYRSFSLLSLSFLSVHICTISCHSSSLFTPSSIILNRDAVSQVR